MYACLSARMRHNHLRVRAYMCAMCAGVRMCVGVSLKTSMRIVCVCIGVRIHAPCGMHTCMAVCMLMCMCICIFRSYANAPTCRGGTWARPHVRTSTRRDVGTSARLHGCTAAYTRSARMRLRTSADRHICTCKRLMKTLKSTPHTARAANHTCTRASRHACATTICVCVRVCGCA